MKSTFLTLLISCCSISFVFCQTENKDSTDYTIYSKVIEEFLKDNSDKDRKHLVFIENTELDEEFSSVIKEFKDSLEKILLYDYHYSVLFESQNKKPFLSKITKQLLIQLDSVNQTSKKISNEKLQFSSYTSSTISESEFKKIFKKKQGWEKFYQKYSNAFGVLRVSKIAYSSDKKQALFYFSYMKGGLYGYGYLLWIDLESKDKMIKEMIRLWVS